MVCIALDHVIVSLSVKVKDISKEQCTLLPFNFLGRTGRFDDLMKWLFLIGFFNTDSCLFGTVAYGNSFISVPALHDELVQKLKNL
ncbi:MAG: hypothetical protein AB8Y83_00335 [Coxiella endosymbiont of Haemaphysalis qinghaiensis]